MSGWTALLKLAVLWKEKKNCPWCFFLPFSSPPPAVEMMTRHLRHYAYHCSTWLYLIANCTISFSYRDIIMRISQYYLFWLLVPLMRFPHTVVGRLFVGYSYCFDKVSSSIYIVMWCLMMSLSEVLYVRTGQQPSCTVLPPPAVVIIKNNNVY